VIAKAINEKNLQQGTVWIAQDITERQRQREELERSVREQEAILNATLIGIGFVRDRKIARCNRRFEQLFGYGAGELAGLDSMVLAADPQDFEQFRDEVLARLSTGETIETERRARRKDGSEFWCKITGRAGRPADARAGRDLDLRGRERPARRARIARKPRARCSSARSSSATPRCRT
jgi:PAS domain S-box-containing protein